jgi:broad specificity phosphatase PhoE
MNNKYYFLRHGKTIYQTKKKGLIYPARDSRAVRLTKKSEREIKKLAKKIKDLKIDFIYSSDFFRAKQTAEIVAKELGKKIIFDKRLRDINLGIYHGKTKKEFYRDFPRVFPLRFIKRPPGGESWQDVQKRMLNFLKKIDKKYKNKRILIVSHGDPLWLLEGAIKGWNLEKFLKTSKPNYIQPGELRKL